MRASLRETMIVAEATRRTMQANRAKDTGPELSLRRQLWRDGQRGYRVHVRKLPGSPDIVFGPQRVAVFVHGCFWHGCPNCNAYQAPKTNAAFWSAKLAENRTRDEAAEHRLTDLGFKVLVAWECQIRSDVASVAARVRSALESAT